MDLVKRLLGSWREKRSADAERDVRSWHEACRTALDGCLQGLRDPSLPQAEIGVTLDRVDRALFQVRDAGSGAQQALRRRAPDLGGRIRRSTEAIVELRNETARFLIRAQGPTPAFLQRGESPAGHPEAYLRAVHDVGQAARARGLAIQRDLDELWSELQAVLARPETPARHG